MTGIPDFNFPLFHRVATQLRAYGHSVFSPAERDEAMYGPTLFKGRGDAAQIASQFSLREALSADTKAISEWADAIAMLPGWEYSSGARAEHALATALKLRFMYL